MAGKVGELYFDLSINKSKFDTELSNLENITDKSSANIKNALNYASSSVENSFNTSAQAIKSSVQSIENSTEQSSQDIKNSFNETSSSAENQFKQSTQQMKTSVEGLEDTVEKSNEEIKNSSKSSSKSMSDNFKTSNKKMKSESDKTATSINNSFKNSAMNIKAAFDMVITSIRAVISGCKNLMSTYQTQIEAEARLEATMKNSTNATDEQIQSVKDLASELQGLGVVGDEVQLAGAQELATYVSNTESIKNMLPVLDDMIAQQYGYSASTDNAVTIATMLGKVLQGQTSALSRYGYSFTEAQEKILKYGTEEERVATLAEVVNESVEGVNAALADTPTGKIKQLSNDFGDLKETLGNLITNVFSPIAQWLDTIVIELNLMFSTINDCVKELFGIEQETVSGTGIADITNDADDASDSVDGTTESVNALKKAIAGFDQLNILSADTDTSESDDTTNYTQSEITPIVNTSSAENNLQKSFGDIKKNIEDLFKNSGIEDFVKEIQKNISEIDFARISSNFELIMQSLKPIAQATFNGLQKIAKSFMKLLGKVIGGISKVVGKSVGILSGGIAKWFSNDKDNISGYISTMSDDVSSCLDNLGSASENILNIVTDSMTRMGPQIENAIANLLSGTSTLLGSLGIIITGAFDGAAQVINQWTIDNQEVIGTFCDNVFRAFDDLCNLVGKVFSDLGESLTQWWNSGGGKELWDSVCQTVMDVGTIILEVINEWIMPIWNALVVAANSLWSDCLKPIFDKLIAVITKLWNDVIYPLWQNVLKPFVDWIINTLGPVFDSVFSTVGSICQTVFEAIGGFVGGLLDALGGLIDFISGVFTGNWEKAWQGISDFFSGIWNGIWSVIKGIINLIIDGLNLLWQGVYAVVSGIANGIGSVAGAIGDLIGQDWHFSMSSDPPLIPKLAKGGLVTAPTLALVGDNKNARSDPEVVAPLSKLKGMITEEQQMGGNSEVLTMLRRIYDLLSNQETQYTNVIYLDSEEIERKQVKIRKRKSRRYGGAV